jgi:hypothetical protein
MDRHKIPTTTVRLEPQDRQAIEVIKDLYGVGSDVAAIRLALRMTARQEGRAQEVSETDHIGEPIGEPVGEPVGERAPVSQPTPTASRLPTYQIYLKHAPGPCPALPSGFSYVDNDNVSRLHCPNPVHRVFSGPTSIDAARRRAEQLQAGDGLVRIWIADARGKQKDSWHKVDGEWKKDS